MNKKINVLLTAAGCPGGPSIIQSLREDASIKIIGTDMENDVPAKYLVDSFYIVPPGRDKNYISSILEIVQKEKIKVILPLATFELSNLANHKNIFKQKGCEVCVSDKRSIDTANNRYLLYKYFEDERFTSKFEVPENWAGLEDKMTKLGFPSKKIAVKPFVSHGSIGLRIVTEDIDLFEQYINHKPNSIYITKRILEEIFKNREFENIIITEFLPGNEYCVDLLMDPVTHKVLTGLTRYNRAVNLSLTNRGEIIENAKLFEIGKYAAEKLNLSYGINIDIKLDVNNRPKILEINPRLPATSFLATSAGLNLPLFSIYLAIGKRFPMPKIQTGSRIYAYRGFLVVDANNNIRNRS